MYSKNPDKNPSKSLLKNEKHKTPSNTKTTRNKKTNGSFHSREASFGRIKSNEPMAEDTILAGFGTLETLQITAFEGGSYPTAKYSQAFNGIRETLSPLEPTGMHTHGLPRW